MTRRTFDMQRASKAGPERPAPGFPHPDGLTALHIAITRYGFTDAGAAPFDGFTIRQAAIDIGRFVGLIPSRRRPLPGAERIGKGMKYMLRTTAMYGAKKEQGYLRELTVDW